MSTVLVKIWVDPTGLKQPMRDALAKIEKIYPYIILTSTTEQTGKRLVNSKHYQGLAIDVRKVTGVGEEVFLTDLIECLRPTHGLPVFDVIEKTTHFHIEHDPKG